MRNLAQNNRVYRKIYVSLHSVSNTPTIMIHFSEYVSLGHPDKIADYISQYLLDRYIEKDPATRYAVEVQIKDYNVTLAGEVSSSVSFTQGEIASYVRQAVNEIGYTRAYADRWGHDNTIFGDGLQVTSYIGQQSSQITQGLHGWGDQGIFFGHCAFIKETAGMPLDHTIAKRLCKQLFDSHIGGLDIKTQVVMDDRAIKKVIVAIPLSKTSTDVVKNFVRRRLPGNYELIVNGTGSYVAHSSIADCGTTGRKLAVDFYGGNCRIGGGSPWTKDASKADLTLNLAARKLAKNYALQNQCDTFVSLACCIGRQDVDVRITDNTDNVIAEGNWLINPAELRKAYHLDTPIYASMCRWGLFGEYQQDKAWE